MSYPEVHSLDDIEISSPMKIQGSKGSKGTSLKNSPEQKKKPAATKGA